MLLMLLFDVLQGFAERIICTDHRGSPSLFRSVPPISGVHVSSLRQARPYLPLTVTLSSASFIAATAEKSPVAVSVILSTTLFSTISVPAVAIGCANGDLITFTTLFRMLISMICVVTELPFSNLVEEVAYVNFRGSGRFACHAGCICEPDQTQH